MAELKDFQEALVNQGRLLGQHHQTVDALSVSVSDLAKQQSVQQTQLAQISANLRDISAHLAQLQVPVRTGIEPAATPLPTSGSFPVGKPEKFDGAPNLCSGFLLQCSIYFANSPPCSDKSRIAFVVSLLIGKALDWATAVWPSYERGTYEDFIKDFKAVFDHPNEGKTAGDLLFQLHQGSRSVAQYALEFRTVAAGTGWNEPALLTAFRHGLHMDIRKELAYRHDGLTLEELISLAIRLDQLKNGANPAPRKSPVYRAPQLPLTPSPLPPLASRSTPELSAEEPMQVDTSRLSPGERQRRMRRGLCLYCGNPGHILRNCSLRPQRNPLSFTNRQDSTAPPSATPRTSAALFSHSAVVNLQNYVPSRTFSHKLSPAERNYGIGDKELLAIKLAFDEWRHWLEGAQYPFLVLTDHKNLEYLRSAKRLNSRQARWSLFFSRFNFQITYRPGTRNTKADALSRIFENEPSEPPASKPILEPNIVLSPVRWEIDDEIDRLNMVEPVPETCPTDRLYVPAQVRDRLVTWAHTSLTSGHPGETRTYQLLSGKYWWESMSKDVHRFVSSCSTCSQCKTPRALPAGKLMPLPIPARPWSHLAVDFVTDLPDSEGNTVILTVIDRFSRGVRFVPFPSLPTAFQTAECLFNYVFRFFGIPENIVSDRGTQFTSQVWSAFMERLGVSVSLTSGYHPQANGQCERMNQELGKFLRVYCHENQNDWSAYLPWAEMAQNSLVSSTTSLTPFQCMLGYQPPLMPWSAQSSDVPSVEHWMRRSEEVWEQTHQRIENVLRKHKHYADRRRGDTPSYNPGDRVWLSTRDFRLTEGSRKLMPKYIGPFKILNKINDVTYKLELPAQYRVCSSFHVSLLKPVVPGPLDAASPEATPPPPVLVEGAPVYAVRRLLDSRRRRGALQYLVDWEGFGPEERSWVPAADVLDPALITDFHNRHPSRPAPRSRGRPRGPFVNPSAGGQRGRPRRFSLSPSANRRRGRPRRFTPSSASDPQGRGPVGGTPVPRRGRSVSVRPDSPAGGGGRHGGRPRSFRSDSLGGGDVTLPGFPCSRASPDSTSQRATFDDATPASNPVRSPSPEF
ncbi:hypothetical protein NFI96_022015 [Prochilodus magdalenae]|nr:hypothetical protein NFI96_022015 [Prochilodus magdalenae]